MNADCEIFHIIKGGKAYQHHIITNSLNASLPLAAKYANKHANVNMGTKKILIPFPADIKSPIKVKRQVTLGIR